VNIRRATSADEVSMRALWDEFTAETTYTPWPGQPFSPSFLDEHVALVGEDDGTAAGTVYANLSDHFGFVFGLYVRPAYRRRGHARALMRAIAAELQAEGRRYILLSVDTPNAAARSLYEGMGFTDAARMLRGNVRDLLE
jgi:ribosomal protein S18 acetylase RimI-like enzyme